jgi:hypothetical protein
LSKLPSFDVICEIVRIGFVDRLTYIIFGFLIVLMGFAMVGLFCRKKNQKTQKVPVLVFALITTQILYGINCFLIAIANIYWYAPVVYYQFMVCPDPVYGYMGWQNLL